MGALTVRPDSAGRHPTGFAAACPIYPLVVRRAWHNCFETVSHLLDFHPCIRETHGHAWSACSMYARAFDHRRIEWNDRRDADDPVDRSFQGYSEDD